MMDIERTPVTDLATLDSLDQRDVLSGYMAGMYGDRDECSPEMNRAYWHGWNNGYRDRHQIMADSKHAKLVSDWLERERRRRATMQSGQGVG